MKLSELFEDTVAQADQAFNMAYQNIRSSIPAEYRSRVQSKAREFMNKGESPSDALSLARTAVIPSDKNSATPKFSAQTAATPTSDPADRLRKDAMGRSLKHDRYYAQRNRDPASRGRLLPKSSSVGQALSKATPKAIAKKAGDKISKELGDLFDIERAFSSNRNKNNPK